MQEHLKVPEEEVKKFQLERVHRLKSQKEHSNDKPRPLVAKFASSESKNWVLGLSKGLKGTQLYLSSQYPAEVVENQQKIIPIMNALIQKRKKNSALQPTNCT